MSVRIREPGALVALALLTVLAAVGLSLPGKWRPNHRMLPFTPQLTAGANHPLCREWQTVARHDFLNGRSIPLAPPRYVLPLRANDHAELIDLDVFGNRKPLRFVVASYELNWRYRTLVVAAFRDPGRRVTSRDEVIKSPSREIFDPYSLASSWEHPVPRILKFNGSIYFANSAPRGDPRITNAKLSIWRLKESGEQETICVLDVVAARPTIRDDLRYLTALSRQLDHVIGADAVCGSLCPQRDIRSLSASVNWRMRRQPWSMLTLSDGERRKILTDGNRAVDILNYWSIRGAWAYEVVSRIKHLVPQARSELAGYYVQEFSMSRNDAENLADTALFSFLITHFNLGSELKGAKTRSLLEAVDALLERKSIVDVASEYYEWSSAYKENKEILPYQEALLYGAPADELRKIPTELKKYLAEPELILAVRSPHLISHIVERDGRGALDLGNGFGKTPLMYAAHFNLHESVKALLDLGADPDRMTLPGTFDIPVRIAGRTALMYAAENSDRRMVELLLAHGADKQLRDTRNWRAQDYLQLNERLSADDKASMSSILQ